jgi:hypothetical protein
MWNKANNYDSQTEIKNLSQFREISILLKHAKIMWKLKLKFGASFIPNLADRAEHESQKT